MMYMFIIIVGLATVGIPVSLGEDIPPFTDKYCRTGAYPPPVSDVVPKFVLNLDLKPEDRWTDLVKPKAANLTLVIEEIKTLVGAFLGETITHDIIDGLFAPMITKFRAPYDRELEGIANATGIPIGEIVMMNIFYELTSHCTAIIAQDMTGDIYHGRNLDLGELLGWDPKTNEYIVTERLKPLVTNVEYQQGGKIVARVVHFAGVTGSLTGLKPGVLSVNVNYRTHKANESAILGLLKWLMGDREANFIGFVVRDAVLSATDFNSTVAHLSTVDTMMPVFFILGGVNQGEGAVISKNQGNSSDLIERLDVAKENWFLVKTNYDSWKAPPFIDDRRTPAIKCMKNMTRSDIGFKGFYNVLSTKPILNVGTIFTALMHVRNGTLDGYLRYCPEPCYPW